MDTGAAALSPLSLLEKAAKVLGAFEGAQPRLSLTEVVRRSGIPRSSAHRILDQLVRLRWLDRDGRDYRMGMRMLELGALASHHNRLRRAALPLLHELHERTGRLVHLSVLDGAEVVCLERIGGSDATAVPSRVGGRMPAHATAAGKAVLAFSDPGTVEHVLAQGLRPRTARTLVRPLALRAELAATRERGSRTTGRRASGGLVRGRAAAGLRAGDRRRLGLLLPGRPRTDPARAGRAGVRAGGVAGALRARPRGPFCVRTPADLEPAVSARAMDNMMGWLRFSEWM